MNCRKRSSRLEQAKADAIERFWAKIDPKNQQKDPIYAAMIANLGGNAGRLLPNYTIWGWRSARS